MKRRLVLALMVLSAAAAAAGALAESVRADQFEVRAEGNPQSCPNPGGVTDTSGEKLERSGTMTSPGSAQGSAPFYVAAGPGVVRGTLSGEVAMPAGVTPCFTPRIWNTSDHTFTVNGPGNGLASLNYHVGGGTVRHACNGLLVCETTVTLLVHVPGRTFRTIVSSAQGTVQNDLGLGVTPTADGFRIEPADLTSPAFSVVAGEPFRVILSMIVDTRNTGGGGAESSNWDHDFGRDAASGRAITFAPSGPVFNLDPDHSVTGKSIVDNRWTDPFALVTPADGTPPTVSCEQPEPVFLLNQQGAEVSATVTDDESGPQQETVSAAADTSSVGQKTVSLTGRDQAGHETTVECGYRVEYAFEGFEDPVDNSPAPNTVRAGQAVPLRWRLTDASGAPVTDLADAGLTAVTLECDLGTTADLSSEQTAGDSGLQNLGDGYYQLNWKTPESYVNSCKTLRLDLGEGTYRSALFRFQR